MKKSDSYGKKCVPNCSNYSGKVVDGRTITLHRIPSGKSKQWMKKQCVKRLQNIRKNLVINDSTRVCSAHFLNFDCSAIPTIFPSKPAKLVKIRKSPLRRVRTAQQSEDNEGSDDEQELSAAAHSSNSEPDLHVEYLHDTADDSGPDDCNHTDVGMQAGAPICTFGMTEDADVSVKFPTIVPEDLRNNDTKTRFYTGFVSYAMFMHIFNFFFKHGANKLSYWAGK